MKKLFIVHIVAMLFILVSCNPQSNEIEDSKHKNNEYGIGEVTIKETNKMLLSNGETIYNILIPEDADNLETFAASEVVELFYEATGKYLDIISDDQMNDFDKYISIGHTKIRSQYDELFMGTSLGISGYRILTKNDHVILSGEQAQGSLYATYQFLYLILNFEAFDSNIYALDKGVTNIPLMDYEITDIPYIQVRAANYGYLEQDIQLTRRFRMEGLYDRFVDFNGTAHNATRVITKDEYYHLHPEWFANEKGSQLSYTAKGNEQKLQLLINTVAEKMKDALRADKTRNLVAFTHDDVPDWDESPKTLSEFNKYGTHAGALIKFVNQVRYKIDDWFATKEGSEYKRDLIIYFFAYQQTIIPPVKYDDVLEKFVPISDDMMLAEGVSPWIAPLTANYTKDYNHPSNQATLEMVQGWSALGTDVLLWTYSTNFNHYLVPFDTFNSMSGIYNTAYDIETYMIFDQGQANNYQAPTGWSKLKAYLNSKLGWNIHADINVLVDKFFTHYFGPAKEEMMKWFNAYRLHSAFLNDTNTRYAGSNSIYLNLVSNEFFSARLLNQWEDYAESALNTIEHLKTSHPSLYKLYSDNIRLEKLSISYLNLALYRNAGVFTDLERQVKLEAFYNETLYFNIQRLSEVEEISILYNNWGLN